MQRKYAEKNREKDQAPIQREIDSIAYFLDTEKFVISRSPYLLQIVIKTIIYSISNWSDNHENRIPYSLIMHIGNQF